ncbi:hypothetical protein [Hymenobacter properus]|uniref:Uncharacterized protein n=1 Tax=Hymenobacter properus TaxID=2791026 RepID=A0A931BJV6_9BACT|nr:hypothetical protein [Hymenobacter properus]MBF9141588.1 hypothetical protein [Hymenobacter properus]MBR7720397.1 hypothetical protein [Microvirga sp. SRT04]
MYQDAELTPKTAVATQPSETACFGNPLLPAVPAASSLSALQRATRQPPHGSRFGVVKRCGQLLPHGKADRHALPVAASEPKRKRSIDDPPWGGIMFLLGVSLCVAAVISGIKIGGLLGLGVGVLMYLVDAYIGARGFAGPDKHASASVYSGPTRHRLKFIILNKARKPTQKDVSDTSLGQIIFIIGGLMMITGIFAGIILGLLSIFPSVSLGTLALWLLFGGCLLAGAAYGGIG